ncbi:hypothetical protein EhV178 [Emiliania huxleyi virus 86]|uniref:Uncharacterized protein n=1 Tax=Emiliania huxleyi virus 86 (isolate United Kingdom/English Channel/1999) TaxID=654925 RepID=Q4A2V6_EHV8U|nr:hypothetical protein EhV178 [Emiliania huxleyi virus 86]AEO97615.1 hypothetical protein ENVG_00412 [Emiliania huxleyi virus 84]AEP15200.1 hypothetical protein EOVG_00263 [Emiliania huxleyi virus 88]AHA54769.1 hypothetical protein EhV145_00218 [Emiliania huxleyi virus 145]AHA55792.1 hypothetical protein EhV164_00203 [Emiliania huxleyi virus 164]CAI65600.1 hypothetical protein EhV178 [Emiliania huxleyi virus 86]
MKLSNITKPVASILFDRVLRFTVIKIIDGTIKDSACVPYDAIWSVDDVVSKSNKTRILRVYGGIDAFICLLKEIQWKDASGNIRQFIRDDDIQTEVTYGKNSNDEKKRTEEELLVGAYPLSMRPPRLYANWWMMFIGIVLTYETTLRGIFAEGLAAAGYGDQVVRWIISGEEEPLYDALYDANIICPVNNIKYTAVEAFISLASFISIPVDFLKLKKDKPKHWKPKIYDRRGNEIDIPHKPVANSNDSILAFDISEPPDTIKINDIEYELVAGFVDNKFALVKRGKYWMSFDETSACGICPVLHMTQQPWLDNYKWMIPNSSPRDFKHSTWIFIQTKSK